MLTSFQPPSLALPNAGSMAVAITLDFTDSGVSHGDLTAEIMDGKVDFVQSVYIDNADNAANLDLTFLGAPVPQRVRAQPYSQGWYPVAWPKGAARFMAQTSQGQKVNVIFANFPMPYFTYGAVPGVLVVPNLTNKGINVLPLAIGNTQLIAGVLGETIKLYRGIFSVDQPTVLKWTSGPGGAVLFTAQLTAGGSIAFQPSGVPWFACAVGNDFTINSSAACNLYGGYGYVQN